MRIRRVASVLTVMTLAAAAGVYPSKVGGGSATPQIARLEPDNAKPGDIITAYGECLGTSTVSDLSLTDGTGHALVTILEHTETSIRFRVPAMLKPGRYLMVIHMAYGRGEGVEQNVALTVRK